jgi:hypothetical protein
VSPFASIDRQYKRNGVLGPLHVLAQLKMLALLQDARFDEAQSTSQLHLPYHHVRAVNPRVWSLTQLTVLDLAHNCLQVLPPEIGRLSCLRELWANHNPALSKIPPEIAACAALELLDMRCTALAKVPREVARLPLLHDLRLTGCDATLDVKQANVYGLGGTDALLAHLAAKAARSYAKVSEEGQTALPVYLCIVFLTYNLPLGFPRRGAGVPAVSPGCCHGCWQRARARRRQGSRACILRWVLTGV